MKHGWWKFRKWLWAKLQVFCEVSEGELKAQAWFTGVEWRKKKLAGFSCNCGLHRF
jgi:hypothetical protein